MTTKTIKQNKMPELLPGEIPEWIKKHYSDSLDANLSMYHLIHLSEKGIRGLREFPQVAAVLWKVQGRENHPDSKKKIEAFEKDAALAKAEVENDFPLLHGLSVVGLWSWLEHYVKGLSALWIEHREDAAMASELHKLEIRYGDYMALAKSERAKYIIDLLEQKLSSPLKQGIDRFESILGVFDLSGPVPKTLKDQLFELQQVRNVVAHRNGVVDNRLVKKCPWLKVKNGQLVKISRDMVNAYGSASVEYLGLIHERVKKQYGVTDKE